MRVTLQKFKTPEGLSLKLPKIPRDFSIHKSFNLIKRGYTVFSGKAHSTSLIYCPNF